MKVIRLEPSAKYRTVRLVLRNGPDSSRDACTRRTTDRRSRRVYVGVDDRELLVVVAIPMHVVCVWIRGVVHARVEVCARLVLVAEAPDVPDLLTHRRSPPGRSVVPWPCCSTCHLYGAPGYVAVSLDPDFRESEALRCSQGVSLCFP